MTFERALGALERSRQRFLATLEGVDEASFACVPPGGPWSAAHVVEHLVRVETRVVRGARRAMEQGGTYRPGRWDLLRKLPYWTGLAGLIRVRAVPGTDPVNEEPAPLPRAAQLERFKAAREATVAFAAEVQGRDLSRIWLRHPFFGAFSVPGMLGWVAWHEDRHRAQLARIVRVVHTR